MLQGLDTIPECLAASRPHSRIGRPLCIATKEQDYTPQTLRRCMYRHVPSTFSCFVLSWNAQLTSLALKLVPGHPTKWPDWILSCVTSFSGHGSSPESILDFLTIVAEEMETADLLGASK